MRIALVSLVAVAACGGGGNTNSQDQVEDEGDVFADDGDPGDVLPPDSNDLPNFPGCPAEQCSTGATIATAAELKALIDATPANGWQNRSEYATGCLTNSVDIPVSAELTIDGADLAIPAFCGANGQGCWRQVLFAVDHAVPNVTGVDIETGAGEVSVYNQLAIHGPTTIRLRATYLDVGPGPALPVVEIVKPCGASCDADEFTCGTSHTCWSSARDFCAYCLDGTNAQCGCFDGEHVDPDGTTCAIRTSGDNGLNGTCQAGECTSH